MWWQDLMAGLSDVLPGFLFLLSLPILLILFVNFVMPAIDLLRMRTCLFFEKIGVAKLVAWFDKRAQASFVRHLEIERKIEEERLRVAQRARREAGEAGQ
jgi:hypothetical protein